MNMIGARIKIMWEEELVDSSIDYIVGKLKLEGFIIH